MFLRYAGKMITAALLLIIKITYLIYRATGCHDPWAGGDRLDNGNRRSKLGRRFLGLVNQLNANSYYGAGVRAKSVLVIILFT